MAHTVVQHSGCGYSGNPQFEKGLEPRHVPTKADANRVKIAGGLLFESYAEADAFCRSDAESLANQMWLSDLNWDNEALMFFDSPIVRAENTSGKPQLVEPSEKGVRGNEDIFSWVQTLRATWILLRKDGSKIVEAEEQPQPRTVQRRVRRSGIEDVSPVTVARVHTSRRPRRVATTGPAEDGDGRHVSVRFPVSGHVRWQPYPSTGNVKPIWIDEHDRGPEDAPYRVGRRFRVNRLDRLPPDSTTPTPDNRK